MRHATLLVSAALLTGHLLSGCGSCPSGCQNGAFVEVNIDPPSEDVWVLGCLNDNCFGDLAVISIAGNRCFRIDEGEPAFSICVSRRSTNEVQLSLSIFGEESSFADGDVYVFEVTDPMSRQQLYRVERGATYSESKACGKCKEARF